MTNDLISREALKAYARKVICGDNPTNSLIIRMFDEIIDKAPSDADRPQGEWMHYEEYTNDRPFYITECPFCKLRVKEETKFCPECGAKMQKGGAE